MILLYGVTGLVLGMLVMGIIAYGWVQRLKARYTTLEWQYRQARDMNTGLEQEKQELESALNRGTEERNRFAEELAALQATLKEKDSRLQQLSEQHEAFKADIQQRADNERHLEKKVAELEKEREQTREHVAEKIKLLEEAKTELSDRFKVMANEIFEEKGKRFVEMNQGRLDELLKPFRTQISDFRHKVEKVYDEEARQRAALKGELDKLYDLNREMNQEARNLTRALKGEKQKQGAWGEFVLEKVLETSGLRRGIEYDTQVNLKGETEDTGTRNFRPDVVVHMPDNRDVIVDAKVSLVAYERYVNSEDEQERNQALKAHLQAVRSHIDSLGNKTYENLSGVNSLDFILMFMPIESAFILAFEQDHTLFDNAFQKKIVVVTPSTLLATVATIKNTWRWRHQNANARKIADDAGKMLDKLRGFVEDMEKLGNQLQTLSKTHEEMFSKLSKGSGNLMKRADRLQNLGVKMKKDMPQSVMDQSEL